MGLIKPGKSCFEISSLLYFSAVCNLPAEEMECLDSREWLLGPHAHFPSTRSVVFHHLQKKAKKITFTEEQKTVMLTDQYFRV